MKLSTSSFKNGGMIPHIYSRYHDNRSPHLYWEGEPKGTKSFVLILDDPDAPMGTWDHWLLINIPPNVHELQENIKLLPNGTKVGLNSWKETEYGGPQPPDKTHRYFFKLYALDTTLNLNHGATKTQIEAEMSGHILDTAELIGCYDVPK